MGLLDSVIGALGGGALGSGRGGRADLLQAVIAMLAQGGLQGARASDGLDRGLGGGLGELVERFEHAGLGTVVASWIGSGHNLPISADQLGSVLGPDVIGQLAEQAGVPQDEVSEQLTRLLPRLVDKLTPNGQLSDVRDTGFGDLGSVLERFSRH
ncbi:MAG TPA: YidB family protein [Methylibium sp.]|uniref:YidB family protein n=1 Tax=Methylibium sp. TaxID=2067992 RepID=UPI002DBDCD47|nr:YidB family protein [Methylibium sp.]HEU4460391.1 YidB family protein [Methylibium sp.]